MNQLINCELRISAFHRGRQFINKNFSLRFHEAHEWNGELSDLVYFIQPTHLEIYKIARQFVNAGQHQHICEISKSIFEYLSRNFKYVPDPQQEQIDHVLYPAEMLQYKAGDCEDLAVLYCSLLGAVGIKTALVEICHADSKKAHLLVLVNTELKPEQIDFLNRNPNRFVFRANQEGAIVLWLPVELTLLGETFDNAWSNAAEQYYVQGIKNGGLAKGIVKVMDVF